MNIDPKSVDAIRRSIDMYESRGREVFPIQHAAGLRHTIGIFEELVQQAGSPIEVIMLAALLRLMEDTSSSMEAEATTPSVSIAAQAPVERFRCDFMVTVHWLGVTVRAAVECDGHDFHERTKEQAKRDRSRDRRLQAAGLMVMRFTGSEIYADAIGCAQQCIDAMTGRCIDESRARYMAQVG